VAILDQQYAAMLGVNARDVQRVTAQFLGPEQVSGALYLPSDARVAVESAWPPPSPIVSLPSVTVRDRASNSASAPVSVESDREYAGAVHRRRLANIDVVVRRRGGTGLVNVGLHVAGISDSETRETAGLTRLVGRCSVRGAGGMDGSELAEASERLGGAITPVVGRDAMGWSMTVPAEALADAVRLVALVAEQPEFAPAAVAVERELQAGDAKRARDDMFQYPLEQVLGQAYPTHAYGLPSLGLPEQVREFGVDQVRAWHQQLHGAPAAVVVVGDVHPSSALDEVSEALRWTGVPAEPIAPVTPVWCADCAYEERHKLQSALAMAFPAAASTAREREYLSVLCALLSGLAGRLFDELRERRSLAYTVAAMRWQARVAGALLTYVATSPEREDEARQAAVEVLRGVADTPPDNEEFRRASNYAGGLLAISRQHATSVADELVEAWVTDTLELPGERAERLRAVTVADVVALSERLAGAERAEFVVRGTSARG
jgi:zinc protease